VLFAICGFLPIASGLVLRSQWAKSLVTRETSRILKEQGFNATYTVSVRLLPLSVELRNVRLDSKDGGAAALTSDKIIAKPKLFALLSGKLVVDQVEIDSPKIRVVYGAHEVKNLGVKIPESTSEKKEPFHAPFSVVSLTDADVDLDIEGIHVMATAIDIDVTADEQDPNEGASFEIASRIGEAKVQNIRAEIDPAAPKGALQKFSVDDDMLCDVDARVRVEPKRILVRRFSAVGSADLDAQGDSWLGCKLPTADWRRVEAQAHQLVIDLPQKPGDLPQVAGRISARAPVPLVNRIPDTPHVEGWVGVSAEGAFVSDKDLPEAQGHFEAHDIRVTKFKFAQEIQADFVIHKNVVAIDKMDVRVADGLATLSNVKVEPLSPGIPVRAKLDVQNPSFFRLLQDLSVARHPHVTWDLKEVHVPLVTGTCNPLHIDGDLNARTENFGVYTDGVDVPGRPRIIAVESARIQNHMAIRPDGLEFHNVRVDFPHGSVDGGFVHLGFDEVLKVDVPRADIALDDISPVADVKLAGRVKGEVHVTGKFTDPKLVADAGIDAFNLANIPFGDISQAHGVFEKNVVDLTGVKATKGKSEYAMPTGRIDLRPPSKLRFDSTIVSENFVMKDLLGLFHLEDDPRFAQIDGVIHTTSNVAVVLGGPDDKCDAGRVDVESTTRVEDMKLYGEHFDDAHLDFDYRQIDGKAGMRGVELDARGITLHKAHENGKAPVGFIIGNAQIALGGAMRGQIMMESMPISKIDALGKAKSYVDGAISGIGRIDGDVDNWNVQSDLDLTPLRVRAAKLGASHVHFAMTQKSKVPEPIGKTKCGAPIGPPFDKDAWARDTSSAGDYIVDGDLFDKQLHVTDLRITRQKNPSMRGKVAFQKMDLTHLSRILFPDSSVADDGTPSDVFTGELSGDLDMTQLRFDDLQHAQMRFQPRALVITRGGQSLALKQGAAAVTLENDTLALPPLTLALSAQNGLKGAIAINGSVGHFWTKPELDLSADLEPIDLGFLVGAVPKLTRAVGTLSGSLKLKGPAADPNVDGALYVRGGEFAISSLPGPISGVEIDARANSSEAEITRAVGKFAGGDLSVKGHTSLSGQTFGVTDGEVVGRNLHFAPQEGVSATVDCDLRVGINANSTAGPQAKLPHIGGDITITSFEYTRPTNIVPDIGGFKVGARRTVVDSYDPSLDSFVLGPDLYVRSKGPLRIRNNLAEVALAVDPRGIALSGTNQRFGLRGEVGATPGGRFHLFANDFDVKRAVITFDDPTRIAPKVDVLATTEYRRYTNTNSQAPGATAGATAGRTNNLWRITLQATGDTEDLKLVMTSDPNQSQEDIFLLLTVGLTRAEVDSVQAGGVYASAAFEAIGTATGADRAVKKAIPVIDDFRFGSGYSPQTGRSEPQVTVGRRVNDRVRASVTTGLSEDRTLRANIETRLSQKLSVQGSYDNYTTLSSSSLGNVGVDFRWRLEFE
jgi:translocation and assembly module TamB